jgi:hypothetical protein
MGKSSLNGINIPVFCGDDDKIFSYKKQGAIGVLLSASLRLRMPCLRIQPIARNSD